jgi:predicted branched-subunit amino acid permease
MTFWLSFSVVFGYLGLEIGTSPWFLSFIPAAYFFGILLKNINSDFNKNLILSAVVLGIIFFKLLDNGILTVELPFSIGKY